MWHAFATWRWDQLHDGQYHDGKFKSWSTTQSAAHPFGHKDGFDIIVSEQDINPDDDFLKLREFFGTASEG